MATYRHQASSKNTANCVFEPQFLLAVPIQDPPSTGAPIVEAAGVHRPRLRDGDHEPDAENARDPAPGSVQNYQAVHGKPHGKTNELEQKP